MTVLRIPVDTRFSPIFILILLIHPISLLKLSPQKSKVNKALAQGEPTATTLLSAHYSPHQEAPGFRNWEKFKRNLYNLRDNIQNDPNEDRSTSDNNDGNRDDAPRREFSVRENPPPTTTSTTFDPLPTTTSTILRNKSSKRRSTRSLKNGTIKVESEKNVDDEYRLAGERVNTKTPTTGKAEAIENFQKAFVNGNDVSPSEAVAFSGMDMGILEKFSNTKSGKSEDKKGIQQDEQLSPLDLEDENNDIKMQGFEQLRKMKGEEETDDILGIRVEEAENDEEDHVVRKELHEIGDEVEESVEASPGDIDSIENSSVFYDAASLNNNAHEEGRLLLNQSSRLTFASAAHSDKVGSGGSSDFQESAGSPTADELKLYRLVQRLLRESPLIDGHNDVPWNLRKFLHGQLLEFDFNSDLRSTPPWSESVWSHTDLPRLRRGLVGAQFWVAYAPCESQNLNAVQITLEQIDLIRRLIARYSDSMMLALSADDIEKAHKAGKIASLIAVEGGHSIGSSIATLRAFYELGVRYMTLTHTCNTPWADSAQPGKKPEDGGLTEFGRLVVGEMNRLGMLVDLSHTSKLTMKDALKVSKAPVIFSHSSAYALCNSSRNVPDDILKSLGYNRGIIMVTFYNIYINCQDQATVKDVADHINYIKGKIGVEHVGIGSDFDGINFTPVGLEDVSKFPNLFVELARGSTWTNKELKSVAGRNFLRVFREAENIRDAMQSAGTPASFELIPPRELGEGSGCRYNLTTGSLS